MNHKVGDLVYQVGSNTIGIITNITDDDDHSDPRYRMIYVIEYANGKRGRHSAAVIDGMKENLQILLKFEKHKQTLEDMCNARTQNR